ncbi:hypothetical protein [Clostridium sp. DMHC 10]|nr:hypothetical protein [Clostridium sp. DMHC 10]
MKNLHDFIKKCMREVKKMNENNKQNTESIQDIVKEIDKIR